MAVVSGSLPKLYISDGSETHSLKFVNYSLGQENNFSSYSNSKLTTTPNRAVSSYVSGETPVSFELETYFHYIDNGGLVSASEKLLWDSLSATTSQEFLSSYKVDFTSSNTNKLTELTIWLEFDTGVVWKLNNMVVETATINLSINSISSIKWVLSGLSINTSSTAPVTYINRFSDEFYRNKLSTVQLSQIGIFYNMPIVDGQITISNTVNYVQRSIMGEFSRPQEHYVSDRVVSGNIKTYMRTGTDNSIELLEKLYTVDPAIGFNLIIEINRCSNLYYTLFHVNSALLTLPKYGTTKPLTLEFSFQARESAVGDNNDLVIEYIKQVNPEVIAAEVNDN